MQGISHFLLFLTMSWSLLVYCSVFSLFVYFVVSKNYHLQHLPIILKIIKINSSLLHHLNFKLIMIISWIKIYKKEGRERIWDEMIICMFLVFWFWEKKIKKSFNIKKESFQFFAFFMLIWFWFYLIFCMFSFSLCFCHLNGWWPPFPLSLSSSSHLSWFLLLLCFYFLLLLGRFPISFPSILTTITLLLFLLFCFIV